LRLRAVELHAPSLRHEIVLVQGDDVAVEKDLSGVVGHPVETVARDERRV